VFLAGYNNKERFKGESTEYTWLFSIARHKVIDYYRKKKLKTILFSACPAFEEIADKALTPERDCLKNELKEEIKKTFGDIGKGYKKMLRLKYIDGFSIEEISKKMRLTIKATESKLMRAKVKFRKNWAYDQKKS